jgi:transposase
MAKRKLCPRDWKEARRLQALELKQKGWTQKYIAEALGVTKGAVSQWMTLAEEQGEDALLARPRPGAPPKLSEEQKRLIPEFLSHGAEAYGFRGDLWTCARVAKVIEWEFNVSYDKSHVSRLLKALEWTPQKPMERAAQRDEAAIAQWRTEVWPELKKKRSWSIEPWC